METSSALLAICDGIRRSPVNSPQIQIQIQKVYSW